MQHIGQIPSNDDTAVLRFLTMWGLQGRPILLQYADYGYDAAQCHVSAKHKALSDGGRRVHGWALWMFGDLLLADHHSVWEDSNGNLVDVTPPSNGGEEILLLETTLPELNKLTGPSSSSPSAPQMRKVLGFGRGRVPTIQTGYAHRISPTLWRTPQV